MYVSSRLSGGGNKYNTFQLSLKHVNNITYTNLHVCNLVVIPTPTNVWYILCCICRKCMRLAPSIRKYIICVYRKDVLPQNSAMAATTEPDGHLILIEFKVLSWNAMWSPWRRLLHFFEVFKELHADHEAPGVIFYTFLWSSRNCMPIMKPLHGVVF